MLRFFIIIAIALMIRENHGRRGHVSATPYSDAMAGNSFADPFGEEAKTLQPRQTEALKDSPFIVRALPGLVQSSF
jgi:hypothetical protein